MRPSIIRSCSLSLIAILAIAAVASGQQSAASGEVIDPGYLHVKGLLSEKRSERKAAAKQLEALADQRLAFGIVDALFFIPSRTRREALGTLEELTGAKPGTSYWSWVEHMGRMGEDLRPAPGYMQWKTVLLSRIDPTYRKVFYAGAPTRIRLEEVVTGGVRLDGIPSVDDPTMVPVSEADLRDDEDVFGVFLDGEARAYPLRILDWHEMLNDVVGDRPVTLSYCTLCGSGVLFDTRTPNGGSYRFGTSGLLYRSNKLMYDRGSLTLWSNLTGEPVIGRLARGKRQLPVLPLVRTTWAEWKKTHPSTLVVQVDERLKSLARQHRFDYRPGLANQARRGVAFPVWKRSDALEQEAEVFALRLGDAAKAYPLELLYEEGVVNDELAGESVVVVADRESGAVRAYKRLDELHRQGDGLVDSVGVTWRQTEEALVLDQASAAAEGGTVSRLERLPGHIAFWFGWYSFFPQTEIYVGQVASEP